MHTKVQGKLRALFVNRAQATKKNAIREYDKVAIKIGRLKQQYKSVAYTYTIQIMPDGNKHYARAIKYQNAEELQKNKPAGIYCLSSNRSDLTASQLWEIYTMLTETESTPAVSSLNWVCAQYIINWSIELMEIYLLAL